MAKHKLETPKMHKRIMFFLYKRYPLCAVGRWFGRSSRSSLSFSLSFLPAFSFGVIRGRKFQSRSRSRATEQATRLESAVFFFNNTNEVSNCKTDDDKNLGASKREFLAFSDNNLLKIVFLSRAFEKAGIKFIIYRSFRLT